MEVTRFEGTDGTEFDVPQAKWNQGKWVKGASFVWEADATQRMQKLAKSPNALLDADQDGFVEIGDGVEFEDPRQARFPDFHDESEFMDLSGNVDARERLGNLPDSTQVAAHIGSRFDAVGIVGIGKRGGFKRVGVVDHADNTVEVDAATFNLQLALARRAMGVDTKGKVVKRSGAKKGFDGSAAV